MFVCLTFVCAGRKKDTRKTGFVVLYSFGVWWEGRKEKRYQKNRFVVLVLVCAGRRVDRRAEEREPLVTCEGGRGEEEGGKVQYHMTTVSTKETSTGFQAHLRKKKRDEYKLYCTTKNLCVKKLLRNALQQRASKWGMACISTLADTQCAKIS